MTSLQTQVCPGHVSLSQINPHPPPLSKQMYIPKTLIWFASASKKKMARSNELLYQSFSILVFPPLDVLPLIISIFFLSFTRSFPFYPSPTRQTQQGFLFLLGFFGWTNWSPVWVLASHHPASHTRTRPSHCVCQAGSGGEPVSVMKSPNEW